MGMYDSVTDRCSECGNLLEWQSKAGECYCSNFSIESVPTEVAKDINEQVEMCPNCGACHIIEIAPASPLNVQMRVRKL